MRVYCRCLKDHPELPHCVLIIHKDFKCKRCNSTLGLGSWDKETYDFFHLMRQNPFPVYSHNTE